MTIKNNKFRFRKHASVGSSSAEDDKEFLSNCFIETGDLSTLKDCKASPRIILGRTGTGKTALIERLASDIEKTIVIRPESLSFNYLTNSNILQFFLEAGVNLNLFFKLLWRHVITVELIKKKYKIINEYNKESFLESIKSFLIHDKKKEKALEYIRKWSDKFWEETEYRIKEITTHIENELKGSLGTQLDLLNIGVSGAKKLTEDQKVDIVKRGQTVINSIQMKELTDILDFLDEDIFDDEKQHYYICIDRLDENWIEEKFRYLLLRSLIETVRDFGKVRNIKIIIALRTDLIERIFRLTRDAGFQEEKYRSLYLPLKWTDNQLEELLYKRINYLVKQSYTKQSVTFKDILPISIDNKSTIKYIISRTLKRPRELIEFFNCCIEHSEERPSISKTHLIAAEQDYSKYRLRSLQDEWYADYPYLIEFSFILRKKPNHFRISDINMQEIQDFYLQYAIDHSDKTDRLSTIARQYIDLEISEINFISTLFNIFYRTGIIGLKTESYSSPQWSYDGPSTIPHLPIDNTTFVYIHPAFWKVLGIKYKG